eukprot:CAMPEP_0119488826 /NCGR_PEP_ID=MMETSP1344-20130328/14475_1 /TAXON_ID=236787 /ORGANISM="Florenciella parvula, Strain CCMP2471" /LENGTH=32 /DNA_ID= /DNA_START= /DNA_END= /DNA_ORIENTATION=
MAVERHRQTMALLRLFIADTWTSQSFSSIAKS